MAFVSITLLLCALHGPCKTVTPYVPGIDLRQMSWGECLSSTGQVVLQKWLADPDHAGYRKGYDIKVRCTIGTGPAPEAS